MKCPFDKHPYCRGLKCRYSEPEVGCVLMEEEEYKEDEFEEEEEDLDEEEE